MKLLTIIPLQVELNGFVDGFVKQGLQTHATTVGRLPALALPELNLTAALGGLGKVQFGVQTQHLLEHCPGVDLVICAGAAGGLADELAVGDVVVGETTIEHDFNNKFSNRPKPRFAGAPTALAALRNLPQSNQPFQLHFGAIASGDEDVVDPVRRDVLRQEMGAMAVAWEGAGGARACKFNNLPFLELRGITDAASHSAASDFTTNLALAMHNLATVIVAWCINHK